VKDLLIGGSYNQEIFAIDSMVVLIFSAHATRAAQTGIHFL
jgi:hypothetical protein